MFIGFQHEIKLFPNVPKAVSSNYKKFSKKLSEPAYEFYLRSLNLNLTIFDQQNIRLSYFSKWIGLCFVENDDPRCDLSGRSYKLKNRARVFSNTHATPTTTFRKFSQSNEKKLAKEFYIFFALTFIHSNWLNNYIFLMISG